MIVTCPGCGYRHMGFHDFAFTHRQPPLPGRRRYGVADAPLLRLMYKEFGRTYAAPRLTKAELLSALASIYRVVYRIPRPALSAYFKAARAQIRNIPGALAAWR